MAHEKILDTFIQKVALDRKQEIKRITLHTFRHSRATDLATKYPAPTLLAYFGWSNINMVKVYVHLAGSDLRQAANEYYGIQTTEEKIVLTQCPVCKIPITTELDKCPQCNHSFIKKFKNQNESSREKLIKLLTDPDISTKIIAILEQGLDKLQEEKEE